MTAAAPRPAERTVNVDRPAGVPLYEPDGRLELVQGRHGQIQDRHVLVNQFQEGRRLRVLGREVQDGFHPVAADDLLRLGGVQAAAHDQSGRNVVIKPAAAPVDQRREIGADEVGASTTRLLHGSRPRLLRKTEESDRK